MTPPESPVRELVLADDDSEEIVRAEGDLVAQPSLALSPDERLSDTEPVLVRLTTREEAESARAASDVAEAAVQDVQAGDLDALAAAATALSRWLVTPPGASTLATIRTDEMLAEWPLPARGHIELGLAELAASRDSEDVEDIAADHARLFVGPGRVIAPPYESVHRSYEGLLFDEETLAVRAWYRRYGLSAPREGREPDDHMGLELEFLATLLGAALEAIDEDDDHDAAVFAQGARDFLDEHVRQWAPTFFGIVLEQATTHFYRGVAHLALGLLDESATILPVAP